jgi:hypothetical protein
MAKIYFYSPRSFAFCDDDEKTNQIERSESQFELSSFLSGSAANGSGNRRIDFNEFLVSISFHPFAHFYIFAPL